MEETVEKALHIFGLNNNEIKVYKACLELGSCSVTRIGERSCVYRTLTYEILKSLTEKGLVSSVVRDKKKYFEAASPKQFLRILKEKEKAIKKVMPNMLNLQQTVKTKPSITMYQGKEGIKAVLEMMLHEAKYFYALSPIKAMNNVLKYYFPHFVERRVKAKIDVKLLVDKEPLTTKYMEYRIIHQKFETGYWIYNNKVIILSCPEKDPLAVVIENENYAKTMRMMFDLAWKG